MNKIKYKQITSITAQGKREARLVFYLSIFFMCFAWLLLSSFLGFVIAIQFWKGYWATVGYALGIPVALAWVLLPVQVIRYFKGRNIKPAETSALVRTTRKIISVIFLLLAGVLLLSLVKLFWWYGNQFGWSPYGYIPAGVGILALILISIQAKRYFRDL